MLRRYVSWRSFVHDVDARGSADGHGIMDFHFVFRFDIRHDRYPFDRWRSLEYAQPFTTCLHTAHIISYSAGRSHREPRPNATRRTGHVSTEDVEEHWRTQLTGTHFTCARVCSPTLRCSACTLSFLPRTVCTRRRIVAGPQGQLSAQHDAHAWPPSCSRKAQREAVFTPPHCRHMPHHTPPSALPPSPPMAISPFKRPVPRRPSQRNGLCSAARPPWPNGDSFVCVPIRSGSTSLPFPDAVLGLCLALSIIITRDLAARVLTQTSVAMVVASKGCSPPLARDSSVCMRFAGGASSSSNPGLA
jgi:hypothetical protein